ncbi:MAG: VOC family protein [Nitrososphaera sp.]
MTKLQNKAYFLACKPILNVKDVNASVDYYCNKLGFTKVFSWTDGGFCDYGKFTFAEVHRGRASIMLSLEEHAEKRVWIYLDLDNIADFELLHQEFKAHGALIVEPPNDKPWHMREMLVKDLDANFMRIGAPFKH